jgi:hypothetical protein
MPACSCPPDGDRYCVRSTAQIFERRDAEEWPRSLYVNSSGLSVHSDGLWVYAGKCACRLCHEEVRDDER